MSSDDSPRPEDDPALEPERDRPGTGQREGWWAFVDLLALTGVTVALPLLGTFRDGAEIFVYRRVSTAAIVVWALLVVFLLPGLLWGIEALVGRIRSTARVPVHEAFVAGLLGLLGYQVAERNLDLASVSNVLFGVWVGAIGLGLLRRWPTGRTIVRLFAVSPIAVLLLFLFTPPVSRIAFASGVGTVSGVSVDEPAPIVMVVFDELPTASLLDEDGAVSTELFPNFASFARDATWFRNTTAVSPSTPEAVPPILTGRYPTDLDSPPVAAEYPENLFSLLAGTHELNVWEMSTQLCPSDQCFGESGAAESGFDALVGDSVDVWLEYMDRPPPEDERPFDVRQSDPEAVDKFADFIDSIEPATEPRLDFLHALLPHQPWRQLPEAGRHDGPFLAEGLSGDDYSWDSDFFAAAGRQRHLVQLQRTDQLLGQLLDRLRVLDRYEESLIVVTADHGVAFTSEAPIRGGAEENVDEVMWVPLLVKLPGQGVGVVDDRPLSIVDVLPTVADALGVELPWEADGRSALDARDPIPGSEVRRLYDWPNNTFEPPAGRDYVEIDGEAGFASLLARPGWPVEADDWEVWRIAPWGPLLGQEAETLVDGTPVLAAASFVDDEGTPLPMDTFSSVDPAADVLPTYLRVELASDEHREVAVAVNGVVAGWGRATGDSSGPGSEAFVLIPPATLRDRQNDLRLYAIDGTLEEPRLRPLGFAPEGAAG